MKEHIYLELDSEQVQQIVAALSFYADDCKRTADFLDGERTKLRNELASLKAELAEAKNLAEAAVAAQTEKQEL